MFSFIRNFFERRRQKAAERDRLCYALLQRVSKALSDYVDAKGDKESLQKWIDDKSRLIFELKDAGEYKRSSFYKQLKYQVAKFDGFWAQACDGIRTIIAKEKQKQAESEQVSKMLNQWVSEQKSQKHKSSKTKDLGRKLGKLSIHSDEMDSVDVHCSCCGKDGKKKMLYSTEGEALIVAEHRSKVIGVPLHVYQCPNGEGFHITSNQG